MKVYNGEFFKLTIQKEFFTSKIVFNKLGAIFFSNNQQHQDVKLPGISFQDESKGSALAAIFKRDLKPARFEIRFHEKFADSHVAVLIEDMLQDKDLKAAREWDMFYQGRKLEIDRTKFLDID